MSLVALVLGLCGFLAGGVAFIRGWDESPDALLEQGATNRGGWRSARGRGGRDFYVEAGAGTSEGGAATLNVRRLGPPTVSALWTGEI